MTPAPHLENGIAAEVRELVERLRIKAARFRASPGTDMYYGCGEARDGELAADMLERLASRPSADHEAVRQRAVEEAAQIAEGAQLGAIPGDEWRSGFNAGRVNAAADIRAALRKPANEKGGEA